MKVWERETYTVYEDEFDRDLHCFSVWSHRDHLGTIYPADLEQQASIIDQLDDGQCVDGWDDGQGDTIDINLYND